MGRFGNVMLTGGETDLELDGRRRRGRALLLHEHRQHPPVQRRRARRPDEARRRRQRPLRARDVRRGGAAGAVGAGHRRRPLRRGRARSRSSTAHPDTPTSSARSPSATTPVDAIAASPSSRRSAPAPRLTAERARHRGRPRPSAGQDTGIRIAHAAALRRPECDRRHVDVPDAPEVISTQPGTCPNCGMKLIPAAAAPSTWTCPMHPEVVSTSQAPARSAG